MSYIDRIRGALRFFSDLRVRVDAIASDLAAVDRRVRAMRNVEVELGRVLEEHERRLAELEARPIRTVEVGDLIARVGRLERRTGPV